MIQRNESETIEFKVEAYNLSIKEKQVDLVKDIVCMYNTPRKEDAHIILGVKEYTDRPKDIRGIDLSTTNPKHLDQSSMQSKVHFKGKI
ncbi:MAG: putative DNA binding domain-containing protein [Hormoscilla sp. SP5CHS1]|nr:putative DNA binding domain-containing protein [Hormoscilla sp. SP5CHS1]